MGGGFCSTLVLVSICACLGPNEGTECGCRCSFIQSGPTHRRDHRWVCVGLRGVQDLVQGASRRCAPCRPWSVSSVASSVAVSSSTVRPPSLRSLAVLPIQGGGGAANGE